MPELRARLFFSIGKPTRMPAGRVQRILARQACSYRCTPGAMQAVGAGLAGEAFPTAVGRTTWTASEEKGKRHGVWHMCAALWETGGYRAHSGSSAERR